MYKQEINTDNNSFCLYVQIRCEGTKKIRIWAEDLGKKNSKYADREVLVEGSRKIYLSFPVAPKRLVLCAVDTANVQSKDFEITTMQTQLRDFNIWIDEESRDFLKLALNFSQVCGFEPASNQGRIFTDEDKKFSIKYFDIIRDYASGKTLNTPARIGHNTGRIEIAKAKFDSYTIPMRMAILLHEFSHVFKNPKIGLNVSDEIGADINALYIYLGLGFSKIDAICVYANVFLKAQTQGNVERMRKIMDYINKFEQEDFAYRK
jgi:hypothetical protein